MSIFFLLYSPARKALTQGVHNVSIVMWEIGSSVSGTLDLFVTNFKIKDSLVKENDILNEALSIMSAQVLDRNLLVERVARLEEALGRSSGDNRVVAKVLVGPGRSPYDTLVIDTGTENGVKVGDLVVYAGSGVIGEIIETTSFSAKIKIYSSSGEEQLVIVGAQHLPVIAYGRGMGNFEAMVPQDSAVVIGDTVVTKENLILGAVTFIEEEPANPFKRIFFRIPFNITEINLVEVIKIKG
ncbi:MAG: rod shape-determining protein MreC [Minisyncoccia bacterium]